MTLASVAAIICVTLVLAGASMGLNGSLAFSQPSPSGSPSPSPSGPAGEAGKIFLLNPNPGYDPRVSLREPPANPMDPDPPKISDKSDGFDTAYHIVAVVKDAPADAFIEAYYTPADENEITAGQLSPVAGAPDTFEFYWDISEATVPAGPGTLTVRLYTQTPTGFEELSSDSVDVRMQHETSVLLAEEPIPEAETVEIAWPSPAGPLGFYKGAGAGTQWRAVVQGTTSPNLADPTAGDPPTTGADQVRVFYSVSPIGTEPQFKQCASTPSSTGGPNGAERWATTCVLAADDVPSQVTALAAVAMQNQSRSVDAPQYTQESADVHRVQPYAQSPSQMKVAIESNPSSFYLARRREFADSGNCLIYKARVTDHLDRPVQGANLDIHIQGPNDQIMFGEDLESANNNANRTSAHQNPQKAHTTELGFDCFDEIVGHEGASQAQHNVPVGDDIKHRESTAGSGISGACASCSFGEYRFGTYSLDPGMTDITVWVDDEELLNERDKRPADDDLLEDTEPRAASFSQWLRNGISVTVDPAGATAAAGTCQRYVVKVRDGNRPVPHANIDVHATGPTNELEFCDPGDATPRAAPQEGAGHTPDDAGEASHAGEPPSAQHTEGVSNEEGNFIIGVTSPTVGDTTLTAWYDGEETFNNDVQDTEPACNCSPSGSAVTNWVASTGDAAISFLNPSPYGPSGEGTQVARTQDADAAYHLVARVSSLEPIAGVEFFVRTGSDPLVKIGDGRHDDGTDMYETYWPVNVADGSHTLVARIAGTSITVEQAIVVNNNPPSPPDPRDAGPLETAEISLPLNGARGAFTRGALTIKGIASAGAEGVDLFYTKAGSIATPGSSAWTSCGYAPVGTGSGPKEFSGECRLQGPDQPGQVTGVAVLPYDCVQAGCNAAPGAAPGGTRNPGARDSGDAHRIFGVEANPLLSVEPAETAGDVGTCQKFVVSLIDQTGQPMPGENVDAHLRGPGNGGNFCAPPDGSGTERGAPNDGDHTSDGDETDEAYHDEGGVRTHHTEADTTGNGRFVFGIESETGGDAQLTVWLDDDDDDHHDEGETNDVSIMHWESEDSPCDISGTDGPDVLEGSDASEKICGFGGDDTIRGGGGDDVIGGGAGNDVLRGNAGSDQVTGGAGRDRAFGGAGGDSLFGGGGPDIVKGHGSNDRLRGNRGNDRLGGGAGRDDCAGGGGRDRLRKCETGARRFAARIRPI